MVLMQKIYWADPGISPTPRMLSKVDVTGNVVPVTDNIVPVTDKVSDGKAALFPGGLLPLRL